MRRGYFLGQVYCFFMTEPLHKLHLGKPNLKNFNAVNYLGPEVFSTKLVALLEEVNHL